MSLKILLKQFKLDALFLSNKDPNKKRIVGKKEGFIIIDHKNITFYMNPLENYKNEQIKVKRISNDIKKQLKKYKRVGVNGSVFTIRNKQLFNNPEFADVHEELEVLRSKKNKSEINNIKKACEHTDECFSELISNWNFKTEKDVVKYIKMYAVKNDLELAFEPIVASNINSQIPHHDNTGKIRKGFCIIDLGFIYNGYCSDMTRTIHIGKITEKDKELYNKLRKAQENCLKQVKPGVKTSKLEKNVRKELNSDEKYFIHALGHGVGIEVHEHPHIHSKSVDELEKDMVITIEPGIYKNKKGIRIEDTLLVREKPVVLTKTKKDLILI